MIDPIDETHAQMADSPYQVLYQVLGWISINSSAWGSTRVQRYEVLPNEDAGAGADQEPGHENE